jgi:hypothetical protein
MMDIFLTILFLILLFAVVVFVLNKVKKSKLQVWVTRKYRKYYEREGG